MVKKTVLSCLLLASIQVYAADTKHEIELTKEEQSRYSYTVDFDECIEIAQGKSKKVCKISRVWRRSDIELKLINDAFEKKNGKKAAEDRLRQIPSKDGFCLTYAGVISCQYWEGYVETNSFFKSFKK